MRQIKFIVVMLFCFVNMGLAEASSLQSIQKIKAQEPDFSQIMAVFFKKVFFSSDGSSIKKKIKAAPYLPTLYVGFDHQIKKGESLSITDNISLASGNITVGPEDNDYDWDLDTGTTLRVRAVWDLDEIVFNRNHFTLLKMQQDQTKLKVKLTNDLYKIYEDRYLYLTQYFFFHSHQSQKAQMAYTKFLLLTDRLNQLTGNQFQHQFWRKK